VCLFDVCCVQRWRSLFGCELRVRRFSDVNDFISIFSVTSMHNHSVSIAREADRHTVARIGRLSAGVGRPVQWRSVVDLTKHASSGLCLDDVIMLSLRWYDIFRVPSQF